MVARRVLLVAYHFPPNSGSSGVQRTLRFAQYLPKFGWDPIVLTIEPSAYPQVAESRGNELPEGLEVHRAMGLDATRQLSIGGRYPGFLAVPDRWRTWSLWGVPMGRRLVRERRIDVLWSTFPIATAHTIGMKLAQHTHVPWVAEFRDPMWQVDYPTERRRNSASKALEARIVESAQRVVTVTESAAGVFRNRFASMPEDKFVAIENGFDEDTFCVAEREIAENGRQHDADVAGRPFTLLHSGIVYPRQRDPSALFTALASLKQSGAIESSRLRLILRASGHDALYRGVVEQLNIADIVELAPPLDYLDALKEMLTVDALLLLQASNCNSQVPAKLYEYLRSGRPILALTDPDGDTAGALGRAGVGTIARLDSSSQIEAVLPQFIAAVRQGNWTAPSTAIVSQHSRAGQTRILARLFDDLVDREAVGMKRPEHRSAERS